MLHSEAATAQFFEYPNKEVSLVFLVQDGVVGLTTALCWVCPNELIAKGVESSNLHLVGISCFFIAKVSYI